jgi:hypothetical protein
MRLIRPLSLLLMLVATSVATRFAFAQTPKHFRNSWHRDSTAFSLTTPLHSVVRDQRTKVRVHVVPDSQWQIGGLHDDSAECMCRLDVRLPDEWLQRFEIVSLSESGKAIIQYDSNMGRIRQYHVGPFDIIATLKAKQAVKDVRDLQLWVRYFAVNVRSKQCLPPSWRLVLNQTRFVTN